MDLALVVEVADATLERDRNAKKRAYSRARIPVYWIINLTENLIEVYTHPSGPTEEPDYRERSNFTASDLIPVLIEGREVARGCSFQKSVVVCNIPPTAVGGVCKSSLYHTTLFWIPPMEIGGGVQIQPSRLDLNDPPTAVGGIEKTDGFVCRSGLNDPPTSVGGIDRLLKTAPVARLRAQELLA
jgi:hypothetical protein